MIQKRIVYELLCPLSVAFILTQAHRYSNYGIFYEWHFPRAAFQPEGRATSRATFQPEGRVTLKKNAQNPSIH